MTDKWKRIVWLVVEAMLFVFVLVAVCGILLLWAGVFSTMLGIDTNDKDMNSPFAMLTLIPTGYEQVIPFARLDVLFNEETGVLKAL